MVDFNLTIAEIADFHADMLDLMADALPTEEEMAEMAAYYGEEAVV
jgi:hypothetical protein